MKIKTLLPLIFLSCILLLPDMAMASKDENKTNRKLLDTILFDSGSIVLKKSSRKILEKVLAQLKAEPGLVIHIEGHADSIGIPEKNVALSLKRAQVVTKWFADRGIQAGRLKAVGRGNTQPVSSNNTVRGRASNRRVEIVKATSLVPTIFFPEKEFEFQPVVDGTEVRHDYAVKNKGKAPLVISKIKTG